MSSPYEGSFDDLFDFPEVPGLEEFGLVPPVREGTDLSEYDLEPGSLEPAAKPVAAVEESEPEDEDRSFVSEARPNPPVPEGVTDLDEDLFGFDELFSLDDDPFYNGTLGADGMPTNDLFVAAANETPEPMAEAPGAPQDELPVIAPEAAPQAAPTAFEEPTAPAAGAAQPAAEPAPQAAAPRAATSATTGPPTNGPGQPAPAAPLPGSLMGQSRAAAATHLDRGPRILLPEDVPYGGPDNSKVIWALIACFLIVNTGIFWLAHMASTSVNNSLTQATGVIATALAQGQSQRPWTPDQATGAGAPAPTVASTPPNAGGTLEYEVEPRVSAPTAEAPINDAPAPAQPKGPAQPRDPAQPTPTRPAADPISDLATERPEPWVDPRDFSDPLTFAVNSAKAMLEDGRFEDARRLLNHVLANQSRMPLKVSLREEIDFLIGLTYYAQGTTTAPESDEVPR